jgi:hypothetical protein
MKKEKLAYFVPESDGGRAAFEAEWPEVEARIKEILPLTDDSGKVVNYNTLVTDIDFSGVADCLLGAPDKTDLVQRFFDMVEKKNGAMTVQDLLQRPAAELTRWRKMGNRLTLLPNAVVLHVNSI